MDSFVRPKVVLEEEYRTSEAVASAVQALLNRKKAAVKRKRKPWQEWTVQKKTACVRAVSGAWILRS